MVLADVIARYHRLKGEKVFFLTGVDQHGQKVQQSAAKAGVPPAEFVKAVHSRVDRSGEETRRANTTTGQRQRAIGTRKLFKAFCSGSSMKARSTRTNSPATTQFVRNNF